MGLKHTALVFKSVVFVLIAFAAVLLFRLAWIEWSGRLTMPFVRAGRITEVLFLFLVGVVITVVLTKLLQLEFRIEAGVGRRPALRRKH